MYIALFQASTLLGPELWMAELGDSGFRVESFEEAFSSPVQGGGANVGEGIGWVSHHFSINS